MKLTVTPIDMSAPGSYGERKRLLKAGARIERAGKSKSVVDMAEAMDDLEALVMPHLELEDGVTIEQVLGELSADEFDEMVKAIAGAETVPNPKSAS
jgi:hypothetical protein